MMNLDHGMNSSILTLLSQILHFELYCLPLILIDDLDLDMSPLNQNLQCHE